MNIEQTFVAVTLDNGQTAVMGLITVGRGDALPDGGEWIAPGWWKREPTDANIFHEVSRTFAAGPQPVRYRIVEEAAIPQDRSYRDAWVEQGGAVTHDMDKARELHREKLRFERGPMLAELDVAYVRADEAGDTQEKKRIADQKQALRDVTADPRIAAAQSIEDLKRITLQG